MDADNNVLENYPDPKLTEEELFTKIWTSPRLVFKFLNDHHYDKYVYGLLILAGIGSTFDRASTQNMEQTSCQYYT